jgi:membrane-bound serine protease (ClpP class)
VLRAAAVLVTGVAALLMVAAAPASAGSEREAGGAAGASDADQFFMVLEVSGLLDPVLVDFIDQQLTVAEDEGAAVLVLQLNSPGAADETDRLQRLVDRMDATDVPIAVWVGPSGAKALDEATWLLAVADETAVSAGSSVEVTPELVAARGGAAPDGEIELEGTRIGDRISAGRAVDLGLVDSAAPIVGEFIIELDGIETQVVGEGEQRRREPVTNPRFVQLPLTSQLLHTVASPPVAYLLFVVGLALLVFELYTAGIGIAGGVGAICVVLGCYGLATLPTRPIGVALLLLAMFGYAVDVQAGVPRTWTGIATVSFVAGSLLLYDGVSVSWITLAVAVIGMTLAMLAGMPAMIRTRFSTPTIGREWMVGESGQAVADIDPDGVVTVREAPWRARTNRATPIRQGERVRVVSIDGLVLEVEPEHGAARDYRDRPASH